MYDQSDITKKCTNFASTCTYYICKSRKTGVNKQINQWLLLIVPDCRVISDH